MAEINDWKEVPIEDWKEVPTQPTGTTTGGPIRPPQVQVGEEPSGGLFGLAGKLGIKEKQYITPPPMGGPKEEPGLEPPGVIGTLLNPVETVQNILTGGTLGLLKTGGKLTKPVAEEALAWGTYNIPKLAKSIYKGATEIIPGLSAKNLEKTIPVEKATPIAAEAGQSFVNKLIPGMAKATTPEMQGIIDLAKREKVSVLAPDITGNRTQALLFNAADKAIGGSGVTQKAAATVIQDMNAYSKRLLSEFGGELEKYGLGDVARAGMETKFAPVEKFGDSLYDIAAKEATGTPTTLTNTTRLVNEIRNSKDFQYLPGPIKSILNKVFSDISPVEKATAGTRYGGISPDTLAKLQEQGIAKIMDFSELESIRRAVSKLSFHKEISGDIGNRLAGQVLGAIDKDMDLATTEAGTLAKSALDDARKFQREQIFGVFKGKTELGKPSIGSRISTIPNEDFLTIISKGNLTELQDMKKVLPPSTIQNVKQAWLTDLFTKHQKDLMTPEGIVKVLNCPAAGREIDKFGDVYLHTLFNKQEFKMIDEFRKLSQHIGFAEKIAGNPSGTAQTIHTIQLITGGATAGYGTWKREPMTAATGLVFMFGGPYAIAKFMTSPGGFRYMTTGIKQSPLIRDIIAQSLKSAAIAGTHANIDINRGGNIPSEGTTVPLEPRQTGGEVIPSPVKPPIEQMSLSKALREWENATPEDKLKMSPTIMDKFFESRSGKKQKKPEQISIEKVK